MLIAIKGLIGSGKTTTSNYLHDKYNVYHYNCDARVKENYRTNSGVIKAVNEQVLNAVGDEINIELLRDVAFGDKDKLLMLEAIIYPILKTEIYEAAANNDIVLLDCQQIDKMQLDIDYNIALKIDDEVLIDRVINRDGRTRKQIEAILEIQKSYELAADYVVLNNDGLAELHQKLDLIMEEINEKANR